MDNMTPAAVPERMTSRQVIDTKDMRDRDATLDALEARMVADMARTAHETGRQFLGWPTFDRLNFSRPFVGVELRGHVLTVPR